MNYYWDKCLVSRRLRDSNERDIIMNTHIVTEPSSLIRKIARETLRNRWKEMFLGIFIYTLLTGYVSSILSFIFPRYETIDIYGQSISYNTSFVGFLYEVLLTGAFMYGLALFMLTFFRTKRIDNKLLFEGFSMLGKTILLQIVMTVYIFLWSLLFVIPGIIAAIRYSMAFYILADHPEYTVSQCINESKARMRGNCGKYFVLLLSFIGWAILASLASELILAPFGTSASTLIGSLISLIPGIFLSVYVKTSETVFYELLTGNLIVMNPDQHVRDNGVDPGNMVNASYEIHEATETVKEPAAETDVPETAGPDQDNIADKVADVFEDLGETVSDATDKLADLQEKACDKIDDIIPDTFEDKVDELSSTLENTAEGAPDVPVQVYDAGGISETASETAAEAEAVADPEIQEVSADTADDTVKEL